MNLFALASTPVAWKRLNTWYWLVLIMLWLSCFATFYTVILLF